MSVLITDPTTTTGTTDRADEATGRLLAALPTALQACVQAAAAAGRRPPYELADAWLDLRDAHATGTRPSARTLHLARLLGQIVAAWFDLVGLTGDGEVPDELAGTWLEALAAAGVDVVEALGADTAADAPAGLLGG